MGPRRRLLRWRRSGTTGADSGRYNGRVGVQFNSAWDARPFSFGGVQALKTGVTTQLLATFGGPIRMRRWFRNAQRVSPISDWWITRRRQSRAHANAAERRGDSHSRSTPLPPDSNSRSHHTASAFERPSERATRPQALSLLQYYPAPNLDAGGRYSYQTPVLVGAPDSAQAM
jgi:hypothetical protein